MGYSVLLDDDEHDLFPESIALSSIGQAMSRDSHERGLPVQENGDCIHLTGNRCGIYERRPRACSRFNCRELTPAAYMLQEHPELVQLLAE